MTLVAAVVPVLPGSPLTMLLRLTKIRDIQKQKEKRLTRSLP
jgi:hypothetical protein